MIEINKHIYKLKFLQISMKLKKITDYIAKNPLPFLAAALVGVSSVSYFIAQSQDETVVRELRAEYNKAYQLAYTASMSLDAYEKTEAISSLIPMIRRNSTAETSLDLLESDNNLLKDTLEKRTGIMPMY